MKGAKKYNVYVGKRNAKGEFANFKKVASVKATNGTYGKVTVKKYRGKKFDLYGSYAVKVQTVAKNGTKSSLSPYRVQ